MGSKVDDQEELNVLVTGFGPFRAMYPVNPSWEIARQLPSQLPPASPPKSQRPAGGAGLAAAPPSSSEARRRVNIQIHPSPIHVGYRAVRALVPRLWGGRATKGHRAVDADAAVDAGASSGGDEIPLPPRRRVDLMIHIGMAGRENVYALERRGHRGGYVSPDVDGEVCDDVGMPHPPPADWVWAGEPSVLETQFDAVDVLARWKDHLPPSFDLRLSDDAGHYLCDFIYFSSLAHCHRLRQRRRVVFLHVPSDASAAAVGRGVQVMLGLIRSLVESEEERGRDWTDVRDPDDPGEGNEEDGEA